MAATEFVFKIENIKSGPTTESNFKDVDKFRLEFIPRNSLDAQSGNTFFGIFIKPSLKLKDRSRWRNIFRIRLLIKSFGIPLLEKEHVGVVDAEYRKGDQNFGCPLFLALNTSSESSYYPRNFLNLHVRVEIGPGTGFYSQATSDLCALLDNPQSSTLTAVVKAVGATYRFPCHLAILRRRSQKLSQILQDLEDNHPLQSPLEWTVTGIAATSFNAFLEYVYLQDTYLLQSSQLVTMQVFILATELEFDLLRKVALEMFNQSEIESDPNVEQSLTLFAFGVAVQDLDENLGNRCTRKGLDNLKGKDLQDDPHILDLQMNKPRSANLLLQTALNDTLEL